MHKNKLYTLILSLILLVPALVAADQPVHRIDVEFDDAGCPVGASPFLAEIETSNRVEWQSVTVTQVVEDGVLVVEVVDVPQSYAVTFDPFAGNSIRSSFYGLAKSPPITSELEAEYKYTVVGLDNPRCPPLDPRMRIKR